MREGPLQEDTIFLVERGHGSRHCPAARGWRPDLQPLDLSGRRHGPGQARNVRAGEFEIAAGATMADILNELTEGRPIPYSLTIPRADLLAGRREAQPPKICSGRHRNLPPEGSLLPDTYAYERGTTGGAARPHAGGHDEQLPRSGPGAIPDLPLETPEELVTLASIVEKETGLARERPQVAAVFVNRLKGHMRLQSDPTTIYGITQGSGPSGAASRSPKLEAKTHYNTYQIDGLPAGPIANPGIEALRAAANPADDDYLYFVAAGNPAEASVRVHLQGTPSRTSRIARCRSATQPGRAAEAAAAREELEAQAAEDAGLDTCAQ